MCQSNFVHLPLHLVGLILTRLDDVQTLGSAILSHSLLYASYQDLGANTVLLAILRNQIPENVMPYAIMAYEAPYVDIAATRGRFRRSDCGYLERYIRHHLNQNEHPLSSFAATLSKTHSVVQYFCDRFIQDTLPLAPQYTGSNPVRSSPTAVSSTEKFRVCKALYRFQIYCDLRVRHKDKLGDLTYIKRSYQAFSPWVNEQIACVHEYLERVLSRAFDEVAAHDVEWGAQSVDWLSSGKDNNIKQAFLTSGLRFLSELDQAQNFQQRQRLLKSTGVPLPATSSSGLTYAFINTRPDICMCCSPGNWSLAARDHWTDQAFELYLAAQPPDGVDGLSSDAFRIWWYAHKHEFADSVEYNPTNALLRRCGYVMWDMPLPEGNFSKSRIRETQHQVHHDPEEIAKAREAMQRSWRERQSIFLAGGRGYWSEGDLNQVVWTAGDKTTRQNQFEVTVR